MTNEEAERHRQERLAARAETYRTQVARLRALAGRDTDTTEESSDD